MNKTNNILELLREKAERLISANKSSITRLEAVEVKKIFHELQVYQLELEMQNDELQLTTIELEQQRVKFANLFELAPTSYFVVNKSGVIKDVNYAACQALGSETKYLLINKPLLLYIYKEDTDIFYRNFQKVVRFREQQSWQIRLVNLKNKVLNVQMDGSSIQSTAGTECYITVTDFTGKHEAEQKLKEAKKTLEIALDASLTGIWEIDVASGKVYIDSFCCLLLGIKQLFFDGNYDSLLNKIHPNERKIVDENIRETIFNEKEFNIRFRNNEPNEGLRYIQARAQIIEEPNGKKRFIGTFTDISEKTIMEQEAARIREEQHQMILAAGLQAEEKEKKRISEVLHDGLAQMLYAIKLNMDQLRTPSSPESYNYVTDLLNESIKEIRNISFELTPTILIDFGLSSTLEDMAVRLSNQQLTIITKVSGISKNLDIQLQLNMFRIIQELINNAIKHAKASKITVEVIKKNKSISVTVSDNGVGFPIEANNEKPKGIGLSSIKNRLRLYKGTIKIESEPGVGTVVYINLKH